MVEAGVSTHHAPSQILAQPLPCSHRWLCPTGPWILQQATPIDPIPQISQLAARWSSSASPPFDFPGSGVGTMATAELEENDPTAR